jgi:hypothetical protein
MGVCPPDHSQFQPLIQGLLNELSVGFWSIELLSKNRFLIFEMDLVGKVFCQAQIVFVHADCSLVSEQGVSVFAPV